MPVGDSRDFQTDGLIVILAALVGGSAIQQKIEMDASTAAMIATNAGDMAGAPVSG